VIVAMLFDEQAVPHPPQLFASFVVLISQPSLCLLPLQSTHGLTHVPLHTPLVQVAVMWLMEQTVKHAPQL
jgi:hypothetical protein